MNVVSNRLRCTRHRCRPLRAGAIVSARGDEFLASKPADALALSSWNGCAQRGTKLPVMPDVPLATHSLAAGLATFGIDQDPLSPASRLGTYSCVVLA